MIQLFIMILVESYLVDDIAKCWVKLILDLDNNVFCLLCDLRIPSIHILR